MGATPRLSLPFLSVGQTQKEFTHNEALQILDVLVGGAVEEPPRDEPPASPAIGSAYIAGAGAGRAWSGKANCVAAWTSGGWRFITPTEGLTLYERTSGAWAQFRNGAWDVGTLIGNAVQIDGKQVVGQRAGSIASPTGGTAVDSEARAAIEAVLAALRQHGLIEA